MNPREPVKTIAQVFEEFLAEQEARVSRGTLSKYHSIINLLRSYLEGYWPGHDQEEYNRITAAGGSFCGSFGPEEIAGGLGEFLGYFMPRKVAAGKETMRAAGTVTKKLVKWLAERGYVEDEEALAAAEERAGDAARELPAAQEIVDLLDAYLADHAPEQYSQELEDHFTITRVEPGKLWLEPLVSGRKEIGPIPVPHEVSRRCKVGWDIGGVAVKTPKGWRLTEVWNVSP